MDKMTLKALRVNAGMTQKEVAKILKVSNKTLSNWENGLTFPNTNYVNAICKLYNVEYIRINFLTECSL